MKKPLPISTDLPETFFREERICDYLVSEKQKRIWAVELDMLLQFDALCQKHDISYSIFAGTMLGAIRHKGFIPWDDDVDVCMDRPNFVKLMRIASEFHAPYFLQTPYNDTRFFCPYARLRNSNTTGVIAGQESPDYNNGIFIDIFVLDGRPDSKWRQIVHKMCLKFAGRLIHAFRQRLDQLHGIKKWSYLISKLVSRGIPYSRLVDIYEKSLAMFNSSSEKFALVTHGYNALPKYWLTVEELSDTMPVLFEGFEFPCVRDYDRVLKRIYVDYMAFPPMEKRGTWHYGIIVFDPDISYKEYLANNNKEKNVR